MSPRFSIDHFESDAVAAMQTAIDALTDAQQKLCYNERRHRAIIQNAVDAIITIGEVGIIESVNPAVETIFGYKDSELIGRNVSILVPPAHHDSHDSYLKRYLATFEARIIGIGRDVEGRHKDGSLIPLHLSIGHFELDGRNYFTGIMQDLTDRRKYEASMRRIGAIFDSSNDAILGKTLSGTITDWNQAAEELYGYSAAEMIGKNVSRIVPNDRLDELNEILERIRRGERVDHIETKRVRRSGELVDVSINISPIRDRNGVVIGASASARNITAQKIAEKMLKKNSARIIAMNDELEAQRDETEAQRQELEDINLKLEASRNAAEAAARVKSEFLANMSHEIRTPLTAIMGYVDLLGDAEELKDASLQMLDTIRRNGQHLLDLINNILDISKIESGKLTIERLRFSPIELIQDVIELMACRATGKGLYLEFKPNASLPSTIVSDPTRLRQILTNLVGNAIKFTHEGGVQVQARLTDADDVPMLEFSVIDSGIGISGDPKRLFIPFEQADARTTRKYGGSGLGLSICARLAEQLGGDISGAGAAGKGSEFRVRITTGPLEGVPMIPPEDCIRRRAVKEGTTIAKLPPCLILLVEDGHDNQLLLTRMLTVAGATVETVDNGEQAVQRLTSPTSGPLPDVVLMDMQMPVMDGYEATRTLRASAFDRPIIALTANAMLEDRQKCLDAGCDIYAAKPVNRALLIETIRQQLTSSTRSMTDPRLSITTQS